MQINAYEKGKNHVNRGVGAQLSIQRSPLNREQINQAVSVTDERFLSRRNTTGWGGIMAI